MDQHTLSPQSEMSDGGLPQPIDATRFQTYVHPVASLDEAKAKLALLDNARTEVANTFDTLVLAVEKNHARYLSGKRSWTYEYRITINERIKICRRQRQHLQEISGRLRRQMREMQTLERHEQRHLGDHSADFYQRFHTMASHLLTPETFAMLMRASNKNDDDPLGV